jgi:branched-chain amino acid transport system ATP-binding protein
MSLAVNDGEVVTLLGRNGMGKTTTLNSIMGIVPVRRGRVEFDGRVVTGLPSFRIARCGLGLVPEGRQVFPNLTVTENLVATAANRSGRADPWTIDRVFAMFPELQQRRMGMANLLSGGEQQMLAIGRALMTNPSLLILDEATEGLAPLIRQEIWACLERLKAEGQSILVVDKNVTDLIRIADRHYIIEKGQVVWEGTSEQLRGQTDLHSRYLGV